MKPLIYGSVCSGIEAASVAWHPLGFQCAFVSEIEPFPCSVLSHHYPETPNLGDMTKFQTWPHYAIDILVGGTPCQSFSIAGLRKGLGDPRGNLMLTYLAIADKYRPKWLVWENVPGVHSSWTDEADGSQSEGSRKNLEQIRSLGRSLGIDEAATLGDSRVEDVTQTADFGCFLTGLSELGYGFAYRIFDAQYFGVAQRRRRVFVVGCLGDYRGAAAVLFERESLCGNPAPSRDAGKRIAPCLSQSLRSSGGIGMSNQELFSQGGGGLTWTPEIQAVTGALCGDTHPGGYSGQDAYTGRLIPTPAYGLDEEQNGAEELMGTLKARTAGGGFEGVVAYQNLICMSTGQAGAEIGIGIGTTLNCNHEAPIVAIQDGRGMDKKQNGKGWDDSGSAFTLDRVSQQAVAFCENQRNEVREMPIAGCLSGIRRGDAKNETFLLDPVAYRTSGNDGVKEQGQRTGALNCATDPNQQIIRNGMAVRRLTPREAERLQGFSDDYTLIPHRGKPAADGPRYKSLGNSFAVPVVRWIGKRIQMVENLQNTP